MKLDLTRILVEAHYAHEQGDTFGQKLAGDWLVMEAEIARLTAALAEAPCQNPRHLYGTGVLGERVGDGYSAACGACASCKARARMKEEK